MTRCILCTKLSNSSPAGRLAFEPGTLPLLCISAPPLPQTCSAKRTFWSPVLSCCPWPLAPEPGLAQQSRLYVLCPFPKRCTGCCVARVLVPSRPVSRSAPLCICSLAAAVCFTLGPLAATLGTALCACALPPPRSGFSFGFLHEQRKKALS